VEYTVTYGSYCAFSHRIENLKCHKMVQVIAFYDILECFDNIIFYNVVDGKPFVNFIPKFYSIIVVYYN
jgi:hypothetical protein